MNASLQQCRTPGCWLCRQHGLRTLRVSRMGDTLPTASAVHSYDSMTLPHKPSMCTMSSLLQYM